MINMIINDSNHRNKQSEVHMRPRAQRVRRRRHVPLLRARARLAGPRRRAARPGSMKQINQHIYIYIDLSLSLYLYLSLSLSIYIYIYRVSALKTSQSHKSVICQLHGLPFT